MVIISATRGQNLAVRRKDERRNTLGMSHKLLRPLCCGCIPKNDAIPRETSQNLAVRRISHADDYRFRQVEVLFPGADVHDAEGTPFVSARVDRDGLAIW